MSWPIYVKLFFSTRTRDLQCERQNCSEILILHMGYFDYAHYALTIRFYGLESIHNRYTIKDVNFFVSWLSMLRKFRTIAIVFTIRILQFRSYNPSFTRLEIWFRFIFLLCTFVATVSLICKMQFTSNFKLSRFFLQCWFFFCMKKYSVVHWSLEQKWMSILMPLLILYNGIIIRQYALVKPSLTWHVLICLPNIDPLFPLSFLVDSWFPGVLDAVFQITFLSALLLFWLCVYHGLRQNDRRFIIFYLPKVLLVGSIWLSMIVVAVWQDIEEVNDPTFSYKLDTDHFYVTEFNHNIKRATINLFFFTI